MQIRRKGWKRLKELEKQGFSPTMYIRMKKVQAMIKAGFSLESIQQECPGIPENILLEYAQYK